MSIFSVIKEHLHVSVVILVIFINFCHSTSKKEEDEGLLETLDKLIQQTEAGRVSTNETKNRNDSNVYYLKDNSRTSKLKPKSSKKKSKSKSRKKLAAIATTTQTPLTDNVTKNEVLNERQDINKSMDNTIHNDTTTEEPNSEEQKINNITFVNNVTSTPVSTENVSSTSQPEKLSGRKLIDYDNVTFKTTTLKTELNNSETTENRILNQTEKIDDNLESELQNKTEGPPSNDTLASDVTTANQSTLDKPPAAIGPESDMSYRKALNMSEPMNKENDQDLNYLSNEKNVQPDYFPHYLDAKIDNLLHDDPDNFIKLLSENAENIKRDFTETETIPLEKPDFDKPDSPELQSEVQRLVRKILVLKSYSRNHYESEEKSLSNEYDKVPSEISFRRFPSTKIVQSNPYSYNKPVSNTYYMKDNYVPVPVPIINTVPTLPVSNNLHVHYGTNTLWNNNLAAMSRAHKMAHISHLSRLIDNLMGRVLYPPMFNVYY